MTRTTTILTIIALVTLAACSGGRHVPMTDDPQSPGWSREHGRPLKHPTQSLWAYPIDDEMRAYWRDHRDRLTQQERQFVLAHLGSEQDLAAEWEGATEDV